MEWIDLGIMFVVCIVEIYLLFDFFYSFFDVKSFFCVKGAWICSGVACLVLYSINLAENSYINLFCVPIVFWIYVTVLFDTNAKSRLLYLVFAYGMLMGAEFLYAIISGFSTKAVNENGIMPLSDYMWQVIAIKILDYIIFMIAKQLSPKSKRHMDNKIFYMCLCLPIATLGTMVTTFYAGVDFSANFTQRLIMSVFFILMLFGSILMFYVFLKYSEEIIQNADRQVIIIRQKADLNNLMKTIELNDKHREIIHNTNNYIRTIGELARTGECEKIIKIVEEINGELEKSKLVLYSNNVILNYLLSEKEADAKKKNVLFKVYVEPNIDFGNVSDIDLISMLGNLVDNAIRAAYERGKESCVEIKIFMQNEGSICISKIVNDYSGEIRLENGRYLSTKKDDGIHGLGIKSVNNTAEKYDGYLECSSDKDKFTSVLVLPV